jgi:superfamily II DNA/RNA helicase
MCTVSAPAAGASGDAISLFSDKDERLLVDIEKLIKQTIKRVEPEGFNPAPTFADERGERRPRRAEDMGRGPAGRPAERARSLGAGSPPRREKVDPWFLKPYEPTKAAAPVAPRSRRRSITKAKPKLAFLLGGAPKQ